VVPGCTAVSLLLSVGASAQGTLPEVTVEATKAKARAGKAKASASPAEMPEKAETPKEGDKARAEAVYATPAAVSTAGRGQIETFGLIDTGDILRAMPGVSTRESPQNAGLAVNIRGFEGSGRVNMMIDGVRQNFRFTGHEAQGFVYVDPALLAGVDVARGAVSTAGGAGALVGAANLRTLDVEDIVLPGKQTGVLSLVSYGTNGVGWSEMLAGGMTNGHVGIAGAISHHEPNSYKNGDGITVPFTDQDLVSGLFKINFALSSEQTLKLGAVLYDNDFFANSYFQNVRSNTYTLKYAYKPRANPLIDFAFNAHANDVRMEYFFDSNPANGPGSAAGRIVEDNGKGFDVTNTTRFGLAGIQVATTYGYEYFTDDVNASNRLTPTSGGGVNPSGESSIGGAFSQTKFSYGMFDLIAGLRYDTYHIEGRFNQGGTLTPLDRTDGRLDPKVTLAAQVLPWLQPYVTYAETFRAPTINETMFGGSHPGGSGPAFVPNPFLEAEVQKGWEFGANFKKDRLLTPSDALRFKAAYFNMDVDNYITGCVVGPPVGGQPPIQFCNAAGTSDVQGVELEGKYDAGRYFADLSYTYTHTDLPTQVNGAGANSFLPEHIVVATGGLRFLDQKLVVGGRVSYFSESYVGAANVGPLLPAGPGGPIAVSTYGSAFMPGYTLVDLFTSYKFDNGVEVGGTVTNLFDVDYTPALTTPIVPLGQTPTAANCFGSNHPNCSDYGRGRTFLLTAKMQF
jgi:hemoglobin/transferrin/lactoferrin receptor protein